MKMSSLEMFADARGFPAISKSSAIRRIKMHSDNTTERKDACRREQTASDGFFKAQGAPLPLWEELMHTYIFRFSICATMHALRWIAVGGAQKVGKDRIRNDIIDASIAAQALCFDGFLSKDAMAQEIYGNSLFILNQFLAFKPSVHGLGTASPPAA